MGSDLDLMIRLEVVGGKIYGVDVSSSLILLDAFLLLGRLVYG